MSELMKTPLNAAHRALNAKMVDFGGWDMPVQYPAGILAEHEAVRTRAGLFDVSHMGEIRVKGPGALALIEHLTPNAVYQLVIGQIHYTAFLYENGTFVDDLLVYREGDEEFLLVVNAGNCDKDFAWVQTHAPAFDCTVVNESPATGQIALQGPRSLAILQPLTETPLEPIGYYFFTHGQVAGVPCLISRTGYTGEDGFELYCAAADAPKVWDAVMAAGTPHGLLPAGLGCRNTLRLECKMALYGHEIDDTIHALEAGLGWIVKLDKGSFIGRDALLAAKAAPAHRKLVGFKTLEKRDIARDHMPVVKDGATVGFVTSGAPSPTCGINLGLAYVPTDQAVLGGRIQIEIRGRAVEAEIIKTPFYKRQK
ncbi:MAG: glycine cleavage system aminomethyltransferase GcvT [Acidobacteria bacterium]|nr:glycine cleavage system aminomethyltransferase GcvT [Acidobacteriota bacterium]